MKIRQIRNATVLLDYGAQKILIDPMLARAASITSLKWITQHRRRNPLVDLPPITEKLLETVTHVLITHCQKGHFDHLDRAAIKWIISKNIPVLCTVKDEDYLKKIGLEVYALEEQLENTFWGGTISLIPCRHGRGIVGSLMAHGYGFILRVPNNPTVYIVGDTIMTAEVRQAVLTYKPDIVIMPGGGALFDIGGEIIMGLEDVLPMANLFSGILIVNHLEALDHCPVTREQVKSICRDHALEQRLKVPLDGEELEF